MRMPAKPPDWRQHITNIGAAAALLRLDDDRYLHWDELRRRPPPDGLTAAQWWSMLKLQRGLVARAVPTPGGPPFLLALTGGVQERLMRVDRACAGQIGSALPELSEGDRHRYVLNALGEEAIQSSLLEGAATPRAQARELLRTGRKPRTNGERMIVNTYVAMRHVANTCAEPLTPDGLLALHRLVTDGTLDDPDDEGRLQTPADQRVQVVDRDTGEVLHTPPDAALIPAQLDALCALVNGASLGWFLHPVLRAVLAHFWLSWLHPFADGNGRTARALFYKVMLREGYWLTEYLPISRRLYQRPKQYALTVLYAESDELDVTYFVLHQLDVLLDTVDDAMAYIARKQAEVRDLARSLPVRGRLNSRQLALVRHALAHPDAEYSFATHQGHHAVSYPTARADLLDLTELGLLVSWKQGKQFVFQPADDLAGRLQRLGEATG